MTYHTDYIIAMTRIAMRRNRGTPLIHCRDPDMLTIDDVIRVNIVSAVAQVHSSAPLCALEDVALDITDDSLYWHPPVEATHSGHIILPPDYMRLMCFEMSDWRHHVDHALTADSPRYHLADSQYSGIRGTPYRPVCVVHPSSLGRIMEFQSCASPSATIVQAKYIPYPTIDIDGGVCIAHQCLHQVISTIIDSIPHELRD